MHEREQQAGIGHCRRFQGLGQRGQGDWFAREIFVTGNIDGDHAGKPDRFIFGFEQGSEGGQVGGLGQVPRSFVAEVRVFLRAAGQDSHKISAPILRFGSSQSRFEKNGRIDILAHSSGEIINGWIISSRHVSPQDIQGEPAHLPIRMLFATGNGGFRFPGVNPQKDPKSIGGAEWFLGGGRTPNITAQRQDGVITLPNQLLNCFFAD